MRESKPRKWISVTGIILAIFTLSCEKDDPPTLTTAEVTEITLNSATSGGNITDDGGAEITARGVVWSTAENPTVDNNHGKTIDGIGKGEFTSDITGLTPGTTYFVRSYAVNSSGTAYGNQLSFITDFEDGTFGTVTDIEGNEYKTVWIGGREWMAKNLHTTKYNDGTAIPTGHSYAQWGVLTTGAYSVYPHSELDGLNSDADVLEAYGALYNWYAVKTGNLCPTGWSVPTDEEWTELVDYLGAQGYPNEASNINGPGNALKSCRQLGSPLGGDCNTGTHPRWNSHSTHYGTDAFGFSALPGGNRSDREYESHYFSAGSGGSWWSSTEYSATNIWMRFMLIQTGMVIRSNASRKGSGLPIRCIRDNL